MIYAGIGARNTPFNKLLLIESISNLLNKKCYLLRSGNALGADRAFQENSTKCEIFTEKDATSEAIKLAEKYHPAWHRVSPLAEKYHGRNSMIILGKDLNKPVDFVICYTLDGKISGGTGMGIRIAKAFNIPVYNLHNESDIKTVENL